MATLSDLAEGSLVVSISAGVISVPPARRPPRTTSIWVGSITTRKSHAPSEIIGLWTSVPKRTSLCTEPPRWLMPWTSAFFVS